MDETEAERLDRLEACLARLLATGEVDAIDTAPAFFLPDIDAATLETVENQETNPPFDSFFIITSLEEQPHIFAVIEARKIIAYSCDHRGIPSRLYTLSKAEGKFKQDFPDALFLETLKHPYRKKAIIGAFISKAVITDKLYRLCLQTIGLSAATACLDTSS